jgi:hypothetical protein
MEHENFAQIIKHRQEIELELTDLLKQTGSNFSLDDIRRVVYEEEDQNDLAKIIPMFDSGQGGVELNNIMEVVMDAWNYFPHKTLGGISPAEKSLQYRQNAKN